MWREESASGALAPQPCSADVTIRRFETPEGKKMTYPFVIKSGQEIIGVPGITYAGNPGVLLCVETRSSFARKGIACRGFYDGTREKAFLSQPCEVRFALRNCSPNAFGRAGYDR